MDDEAGLLARVREQVQAGRYRVRSHAVRHMVEEGFDEHQLRAALGDKLKMLELYEEENRCLLLGYFRFAPGAKSRTPLHVVCDFSNAGFVDVVTAYIPQRPWWISPARRGDR